MSVKLRMFKVLNTSSGYSHKLSRNSSFLAYHKRLSTRNLKTLQIFGIAKVSLVNAHSRYCVCTVDIDVHTVDICVRTVDIYVRTVDIYVCTLDICVCICNDLVRKRLSQPKLTYINNHVFFSNTSAVTNFILLYCAGLLAASYSFNHLLGTMQTFYFVPC